MKISPNVVVIPTVNEAGNIRILLPELLSLDLDILIVDDASTDGTVQVATKMGEGNGRVTILSRPAKMGLGSAYIEGFHECLSLGYENIVQMDADGSHRVEDLKKMLKLLLESRDTDVVIGSRWIPGGRVENWSKHRELLSRVANRYSKSLLATSINDMTAGFRIYRAEILRKMDLKGIESQGYSFQIEMTREALRIGAKVTEMPITFIERTIGVSKMNKGIVVEAIVKVTKWGLMRKFPSNFSS
jgi:dolichol-phosphate mannosyltransferase